MLSPAEELEELLKREKEQGITDVDPWLDAFMKAEIRKGKRETVVSDYVIKILGLDVSIALSLLAAYCCARAAAASGLGRSMPSAVSCYHRASPARGNQAAYGAALWCLQTQD